MDHMPSSQPLQLPTISTDDLLRMIGDLTVTSQRQAMLITQQAARIAELEASMVTTTSFEAE
jgi:hypothetical protein